MKAHLNLLLVIIFCWQLVSVHTGVAAGAGGMSGPKFGGDLTRLFGTNSAFTAALEMRTKGGPTDEEMIIPGKLTFDNGKARFEIDVTQMKGAPMPPGAAAQMKAMGMEKMISISRPDKKIGYLLYPGLRAYVEMPMQEAQSEPSDYKLQTTELGKETIHGHACVKNKAVVTDKQGNQHESTVWNATDLKGFPVKIETAEGGAQVTMQFEEVKLGKPAAAQFDAPSDFTQYENPMKMMQQEMMKRNSGGQVPPPGGAPGGAQQP
jgi:hypothetical protein